MGDDIDVVKTEGDLLGWSTGKIIEKENNLLKIKYQNEPDMISLSTNAIEIAPYGAYTSKNEWRQKLQKGDLVDCIDTSTNWYSSTILDVKKNEDSMKVLIGYRTYREDGLKKDENGKTYQGWSHTFDEWLSAFSIRIQPINSISKQGYIECKKSEDEFDSEAIDDSKDILLNSPCGKQVFCLQSPGSEVSEVIINMLNTFGDNGGFDKILDKIANKENPLPFGIFILTY